MGNKEKTIEGLTAAQIAALAGVVPPKAAGDAKQQLDEGSTAEVDFAVRIRGQVVKRIGTPASSYQEPATFRLAGADVYAELFRLLKVEPAQLRRMLKSIATKMLKDKLPTAGEDHELLKIFGEVEQQVAARLPDVARQRPARAGSVHVDASYEVIK